MVAVIKFSSSPYLFVCYCRLSSKLLKNSQFCAWNLCHYNAIINKNNTGSQGVQFKATNRHCTTMATTTAEASSDSSNKNTLFTGEKDRFNGVTVNSKKESCSLEDFKTKLEGSLKHWFSDSKRGIWFKVNLEQADWIPVLAKKGFKFHHAQSDFVMMYKWLPPKENCNIPPYAFTLIGVGAVVVNEKSQILVVNEKHYERPHWKLPGGYVEPGENIVDAAIREVMEETRIETEFKSFLTFRHSHHGMFGCSDIYAIVALRPLTEEIKIGEQEISKCCWMDLEEYMNHPHIHSLNRFFLQKYLDYEKNGIKIDITHGIHDVMKTPYTVYHVVK